MFGDPPLSVNELLHVTWFPLTGRNGFQNYTFDDSDFTDRSSGFCIDFFAFIFDVFFFIFSFSFLFFFFFFCNLTGRAYNVDFEILKQF